LDALERRRRADLSLEECFSRDRSEPFFVKNLENIQGDERDVIFLSIGYGRKADGSFSYNFGPLNRENGKRRLNVLVSRARRRMRVFSPIQAGDIDVGALATEGPRLLRDFLHFAATSRLQRVVQNHGEADSPFEEEVQRILEEHGYIAEMQVGVGQYRIDLGVRHPTHPGVYLAGIECDGAAYHSAPCARDRDRLRQMVLETRGWTILRIWSTDWFKDRAGTTRRLIRTLETLRQDVLTSEPAT
jgi:very-short-patch-repair endonuclease